MKPTVTINAQILSGNLGDGFIDQNEAAREFATFVESLYESALEEMPEQFNYNIYMSVLENCEGASSETKIDVTPYDYALDSKINGIISEIDSYAFDKWCNSDISEHLWK